MFTLNINQDLDRACFFKWTFLIFQLFQVAPEVGEFRVVALTSDRLVNFRLASNNLDLLEDGNDVTRQLKSSSWKTTSKLPVPRLEQPNLIQGVAAGGKLIL